MPAENSLAEFWGEVLNQDLDDIVEEYQCGQFFGPGRKANKFLYSCYQQAHSLGLGEHRFVKKLGEAIAPGSRNKLRPCIVDIANVLEVLPGEHRHQSQALHTLAEML